MIEKHKTETEEWIKSEREKIDEEKRKLAAEQVKSKQTFATMLIIS